MGVKETVDAKIGGKKVMMFSKSSCPYCVMAKRVLERYVGQELDSEDYEVWELNNQPDGSAIQDYLLRITGARTVPRVFINGQCIGGGTETQAADRSGQLAKLLTAR